MINYKLTNYYFSHRDKYAYIKLGKPFRYINKIVYMIIY